MKDNENNNNSWEYFELPNYPNATERATGPIDNVDKERSKYVLVYTSLMLFVLYLVFQRAFAFFCICLRASRQIHNKLFYGVIRARMYFFSTNSSGRIINRFSKDIIDIDTALPIAMYDSVLVRISLIFSRYLVFLFTHGDFAYLLAFIRTRCQLL